MFTLRVEDMQIDVGRIIFALSLFIKLKTVEYGIVSSTVGILKIL